MFMRKTKGVFIGFFMVFLTLATARGEGVISFFSQQKIVFTTLTGPIVSFTLTPQTSIVNPYHNFKFITNTSAELTPRRDSFLKCLEFGWISYNDKQDKEVGAQKMIDIQEGESKVNWERIHSYMNLAVLGLLLIVLIMLYKQFREKRASNAILQAQNAEITEQNAEILYQKEEIEKQRNELESQKEELKEKNEQLERFNWLIIDSIDYASSIQAAFLPTIDVFSPFFEDQLVIYFPKDVVSGDFYWAYTINNTIVLAVADCTGHGVPGGFMSMLGMSALTELMGRHVFEPDNILNNLRKFVIQSLKQTGRIGEHQEGLEISVVTYTKGNSYIEFAGTNQPIWLVKKMDQYFQIMEYRGNRMPISYIAKMDHFTSQKIPVSPGDQLYLFSDGYYHQLGGENFSQKFSKRRFKSLILQNAHLIMDQQKNIIEDEFFRWVSGYDQVDDITILGLKF